jgi:uncharacterized membrane protein YkvA (DUF1232 family)
VGTHGPGGRAGEARLNKLRGWARALKRDAHAVWLCARDPRTPWAAKAVAFATAAYAFSPIDLIPDFIPVLGYLDDLILVPAGLWLAMRLIPPEILAEHRATAAAAADNPVSRLAGHVIQVIWGAAAVFLIALAVQALLR